MNLGFKATASRDLCTVRDGTEVCDYIIGREATYYIVPLRDLSMTVQLRLGTLYLLYGTTFAHLTDAAAMRGHRPRGRRGNINLLNSKTWEYTKCKVSTGDFFHGLRHQIVLGQNRALTPPCGFSSPYFIGASCSGGGPSRHWN